MLAAAVLTLCALFPAPGGEQPKSMPPPGFAREFRKHCVQVYVRAKTADGKPPAVGTFKDDLLNERPTRLGGYWWDEKHVLVEDAGLTGKFIRSIEIALPGGGERWPARVAARFERLQAMLLEVLPAGDGGLPAAAPLEFTRSRFDFDGHFVASYAWDGEWRVRLDGALGVRSWEDGGAETLQIKNRGIVFSGAGAALGAAFGESLRVPGGSDWPWRALMASGILRAERYDRLQDEMRGRLRRAALEAHFRLRVELEDDADALAPAPDSAGGIDESTAELRTVALVVGPGRVLIPAPLDARGIARIESIVLRLADGAEAPARFIGAARDYLALFAATDADLNADDVPPGFALLDPFVVPDEAFAPESDFAGLNALGLFLRWRVDYDLGRRRETFDHDRWLGIHRGYRDVPIVSTLANEENGSLAFDLDGRLVAVALAQRIPPLDSPAAGGVRTGAPAFRPLRQVYESLHGERALDPTLVPADREDGKRLIALGVEWQKLDANTSRLFQAEAATRGGKIGLLVIRVYPDTPAADIGLREHDVLLRVFVPGQTEPVELSPSTEHMPGISLLDLEDVSAEATQRLMASLPPPWPSRENALTSLLGGVGVWRTVRIEYLREGKLREAEFVTRYSPPDFKNAPHFKARALGMTVKPVTQEVRSFFRRDDDSGVIVSKVDAGGRAAVAGLHPYLLVLAVDGRPVAGYAEFKAAISGFEEGEAAAIGLLVEGFGKTRLVKIEK
jgi:hypothetical protein